MNDFQSAVFLKVNASIHVWEAARVCDEQDNLELVPFADEESFEFVVKIADGQIEHWPSSLGEVSLEFQMEKASAFYLLDHNKEVIGEWDRLEIVPVLKPTEGPYDFGNGNARKRCVSLTITEQRAIQGWPTDLMDWSWLEEGGWRLFRTQDERGHAIGIGSFD